MNGPLRRPDFRRLWLAGLLSLTGSEMSRLALVLYVFHSYNAVGGIAVLVALRTVAGAVIAPAAGVIVDRFDKRAVMIASDLARALFIGGILLYPTPLVVYAMSTCEALAGAIFDPARSATIPRVVDRGEVPAANGLYRAASSVTMIVGPMAGAELFLAAGLAPALVVDVITYVLSAMLLAGMSPTSAFHDARGAEPAGFFRSVGEGWQVLARHEPARQLAVLFLVSMLCGGLWLPLAPFFIRDYLGATDRLLGVQFSAFGAGGIAGGLLAVRLAARLDKGVVIFAALLGEGIVMTAYAIVSQPALSSAVLFCWGAAVSVIGVTGSSILQVTVHPGVLGRIFAIIQQVESIAMLLAMYLAVAFGETAGARAIILTAGVTYFWVVALSTMTRGGRALRLTP